MWIDSIGRLQSVPMTQCRSTIRRWDMRPESVAVRLKTGRNPMVCCSGSEEELVIAAEIVALVRVLMSSSKEWASSFNVVLRQSLCSTFSLSTFRMFRGSLSVLGGYVEPIRKGCFVQVALGGGGGDEEKSIRRCGRVAEIVSSVDKSSNQVRVTLSEDTVSNSNESIWISQESVRSEIFYSSLSLFIHITIMRIFKHQHSLRTQVRPLCDVSVDTTHIESRSTIVSTLLDLASVEGRMIEWIVNGEPIDSQVLSVIRMYASKALSEIAKSDTRCLAGLFEELKGLRDSRRLDVASLERDFTKCQLISRRAFMSNTRSLPEAYTLYVRLHDCSENVIRGGGVDSRRRFDMFTCAFIFFDSAQKSVQKAISSPARGSDEVRRRSVCWKDEEILTFNVFGDVTEARLELSMRCVAIDKQDKSITNEIFLGSSSLKVGRYAVKSLVESDAHSNFVIEGLNKVRRFSLRAPEDSDVEDVDGRNDYGTIGLSFVLVPISKQRKRDDDVDERIEDNTTAESCIFPRKFSSREGPSVLTWSFDGAVSPLSTPSNTLVTYSFSNQTKQKQDLFTKCSIEDKERYGLKLDKGQGLLLRHGFGGGPSESDMYVNEYTILMDVKGDGETDLLRTQFESKSTQWSQNLSNNSFERVAMVVNMSVPYVRYYSNGSLVKEFKGNTKKDSVFSLDSIISIVPGTCDNTTILSLQIREYALSEKQIARLGKARFQGLPSDVTEDTIELLLSRLDTSLRDVVTVSDARDALRETRGNLRLANDWLRRHTTRIVSKKYNYLSLMRAMKLTARENLNLKTFKVTPLNSGVDEKNSSRTRTNTSTIKRKTSLEDLESDRFSNLVRLMRDKYVASSIELVLRDGKSKSTLRETFLRTDERTRFLFVRALSLNVNLENVLDVEEYVKTHCVKDVLQSLARISASTTPSLKISQDISWTLLWQSRVSNNSFTSYLFRGGQVRKGYKLLGDRLVTSCSIQPVM